MRALSACVVMIIAASSLPSHAGEQTAATRLHIKADDTQSLKEGLLDLAQERLRPSGLFVDRQRARMDLSGSLASASMVEVRPTWPANAQMALLPLTFELRPVLQSGPPSLVGQVSRVGPVQATLVVPLLRDVWVAARPLLKGSNVACGDLVVQRRSVRNVPKLSLPMPCEVGPESVALRDIGTRDVMRSIDIGRAPDVTAGAPVQVSVSAGGINVTAAAIALADARVGDLIDVRLQHPVRTLRTRVTGPGSVQLTDGSL